MVRQFAVMRIGENLGAFRDELLLARREGAMQRL